MWDGNTRNKGWVSFARLLALFRQKTRRANNEHQLVLSTSTVVLDPRGIPYSVRTSKNDEQEKTRSPANAASHVAVYSLSNPSLGLNLKLRFELTHPRPALSK